MWGANGVWHHHQEEILDVASSTFEPGAPTLTPNPASWGSRQLVTADIEMRHHGFLLYPSARSQGLRTSRWASRRVRQGN